MSDESQIDAKPNQTLALDLDRTKALLQEATVKNWATPTNDELDRLWALLDEIPALIGEVDQLRKLVGRMNDLVVATSEQRCRLGNERDQLRFALDNVIAAGDDCAVHMEISGRTAYERHTQWHEATKDYRHD